MEKEIKIVPPPGYEIDRENSTLECIRFKPKLTYEDIARALFENNNSYYVTTDGAIRQTYCIASFDNPNTYYSERQAMKLIALNMLSNVAKYLNEGWKPDFCNKHEDKFYIYLMQGDIKIRRNIFIDFGVPCFKTRELAEQAINILGEETIKHALSCV